MLFNRKMDIDEIRRQNIRALEASLGAPFIANAAGMSLAQFYNLRDGAKDSKTGKRRGMRKETAWKIEDAAGVSRGYLDALHTETISGDNFTAGPDIRGRVPVVSWVTAGNWADVIDLHAPGVAEEWFPCMRPHGVRTFALRVSGVSMENLGSRATYSDGDIIFVDPDRHADHGSMVVVRLDNEKQATFKQLVVEGERKFLRALNPSWPEKLIEINGNATLCGVVIGKWTDT